MNFTFFEKIILFLFPKLGEKLFEQGKVTGTHHGRQLEAREFIQRRAEARAIEYGTFIGKPVIVFENSNRFPAIGIVSRLEMAGLRGDTPVPVIKNYMTGETVYTHSRLHHFSDQRLRLACRLSGEDVWAIISNMTHHGIVFKKERLFSKEAHHGIRYNRAVKTLKNNGFFKDAGLEDSI